MADAVNRFIVGPYLSIMVKDDGIVCEQVLLRKRKNKVIIIIVKSSF